VAAGQRIGITFTVRNTGRVASDEVAQLYVRDPLASVARPVKELRGFARFQLAPGASKRITFSLLPEQLAIYDMNSQWVVEAGAIEFMIGAASDDIRLRGTFEVERTFATSTPAAALATDVSIGTVGKH
jgi:beta-glucosidase